jgi:Domain of unknown function (DUF5655)
MRQSITFSSRSRMPSRRLWKCPRCGHEFVTKNLWHSCVRVPLADHFRGKPVERKQTWDRLLGVAHDCGPVKAYAQKTRIVIQSRVRFAGVTVRRSYLDAGLWLHRRSDHPRLFRVEDFGRLGFVLHFRLEEPTDVDTALRALIREAYQAARDGPSARLRA